jgi:sec-independent protein translocase protein TatC
MTRADRMPLAEHLRELRRRVGISLVGIAILSVIGWFQYQPIINALSAPICDLEAAQRAGSDSCGVLYISGVLGPLSLQLKVTLISGILLASPIWIYQTWAFIAPGLHRRERRRTVLFAAVATPLFAAGAYLAYAILPLAVRILIGFTPDALNNLIRFDEYLDFVLKLILVFGLAFELPVFLIALNFAGLVSARAMIAKWRIAVFLIFLFAAVATPTGDPITMSILALPLCLLYLGAIGVATLHDRAQKRDEIDPDLPPEPIEAPSPITSDSES